jgi:hypothetical protein
MNPTSHGRLTKVDLREAFATPWTQAIEDLYQGTASAVPYGY